MLIEETISELITSELSPEATCERIQQLSSVELNGEALEQAVRAMVNFADAEAVEAVHSISGAFDCCGTGGSGLPHFNTSTTVSFVLASAGVKVVKFGNRASTSLSGSFDFLEALGISCYPQPNTFGKIIAETDLLFLFAQQFYPAFKKLVPVRRALGLRTIFNLVGPLLSPVHPQFRLLGVADQREQNAIAEYLAVQKVCERALVVSSHSGLDELDPMANNRALEIDRFSTREFEIRSPKSPRVEHNGGLNLEMNCRIFESLINNNVDEFSYYRALVCLNAGAGLFVARKADSIEEGVGISSELLSSGAVLRKFQQCRRAYERYAG